MDRKQLKKAARNALGNRYFSNEWLLGILIIIVFSVVVTLSGIVVIGPLLLTGPLVYGLQKAFLRSARSGESVEIGTLFDGLRDDFGGTFVLNLMITIFTFLWSLLLFVPGIIKLISYSMSFFVKADHPEYDWHQCMDASKQMTKGHVGELFVLYLSFIPFAFVGSLILGLGTLWLPPYINATMVQYYEALRPVEINA